MSVKPIVACGKGHTVGLKPDGTCVAVGYNNYGQCNVTGWTNIVDIACGYYHTVGLKNDGTCVAVGDNNYGRCNVTGWTNIVVVGGSSCTVGLKPDGTCVAVGDNSYGQCNVSNWKLKLFKQGLLTSKTGLNCIGVTAVEGFNLTGVQPANTNRRVIFKIDNSWNKLTTANNTTTLTAVTTQTLTSDSVLAEGNTVDELAAITSIPSFVGKIVYPAIGMFADTDVEVMPSLGIELKTRHNQDQYTKVVYSPEYTISTGETGMMYDARLSTTVSEGGSIVVEASIKNGETWSEYMPLMSAKNKPANVIKFKATYTVTTLGVSAAKINYLLVYCRSNNSVILGTNADIITKTQDFGTGMLYARLLVKHEQLKDARIKAYISFTESTFTREKLNIGSGTGTTQTIQLTDSGIDHSSIRLYFNLQQEYSFDYNSELNQITFTAPQDANIFVSYTYGLEPESWQAMQFGSTQKYNNTNYYSSDFTYEVSAGTEKGVSSIRIVLEKPIGSSKDAILGTGTGRQQIFILDHYAQPETLIIKATGVELPRSVWNYDDVNKILTIVAPKDAQLTYDCVWNAETPVVKGFVCAWNE